jgi:hypothetical protein
MEKRDGSDRRNDVKCAGLAPSSLPHVLDEHVATFLWQVALVAVLILRSESNIKIVEAKIVLLFLLISSPLL